MNNDDVKPAAKRSKWGSAGQIEAMAAGRKKKMQIRKETFLRLLEQYDASDKTASSESGIPMITHRRWEAQDPEYKEKVEAIRRRVVAKAEDIIDSVISVVHKGGEKFIKDAQNTHLIRMALDTARFVLKTKGGYVEKQEHEHTGGISVISSVITKLEEDKHA